MPIPPKFAFKSICDICGWSVVIKHRSDAIFQPNKCEKCEKCGSEKLTHTQAGVLETLLAAPISFIQNIGKRNAN
jgi:hypothetical protein